MKDPYFLIKEKREPIPGNYMHVLDPKKGLKPGLKFTLNSCQLTVAKTIFWS